MNYCSLVNTKQGSRSVHRFSNGNTLPLVQLPFGMTAFCPQTSNDLRWFYHPENRSFEGIRLTHQPSPWIADYGSVVFLPQSCEPMLYAGDRWSGFRPQNAVLAPFYLKYRLLRSRSTVELSPTERCAKIRIIFDCDGENYFSALPVKDDYCYEFSKEENTLYISTNCSFGGEAVNFREFVIVRFPENSVIAEETKIHAGKDEAENGYSVSGENTAIHIRLKNRETEISVGASYVSFEQAKLNIESEISNRSFDEIKADAEKIWESYLSRIEIEAKDEKQLKTFYSCMYRAFLYPHKCSEIDARGKEIHYCPHNGKIHDGVRYTDNGFWDTYRTVYPFLALVAKNELKEMVKSFINEYRESGWLPRWLSIGEHGCMPSTLVDAVICDAAVRGFVDRGDLETALEGMLKHATTNSPDSRFGRNGAESYCKLGYVPFDEQRESVNLTQDAAYGDWCIAEIAKILGRSDIEKEYRLRAENYKNIFDRETGFMRARNSSGEFRADFSPIGWGRDYTEGSAWQNSFAVPHDMNGLAELYGGKDALISKIDALFNASPDYEITGYDCEIHEITEMAASDFGQCAISNQPSFHIPYIYSELGDVDKTAYWVKRLCEEAFSFEDDGFPGDEDNGSMALWYIFGVLGFYPFCPGRADFVKGAKQVKRAFINGKEIDIDKVNGNSVPYELFK